MLNSTVFQIQQFLFSLFFRWQRSPVVEYVGWVGHKNFGDEYMYSAIMRALPNVRLINYANHEPVNLDATILGGGTLIFHKVYLDKLRHSQANGVPTFVLGTGVLDLRFWRESKADWFSETVETDWKTLLTNYQTKILGVRGPESVRLLNSAGVGDVQHIGDPFLLAAKPVRTLTRDKTICVNLGSHDPIWGDEAQFHSEVGKFLAALKAEGWTIEFALMHPVDREPTDNVIAAGNLGDVPVIETYLDCDAWYEGLSKYRALVGQRLHSAVAATSRGIPSILLAYNPKCVDYMTSVRQQDFAVRTDEVTSDYLMMKFREMDAKAEQISQDLGGVVKWYRMRLRTKVTRFLWAMTKLIWETRSSRKTA